MNSATAGTLSRESLSRGLLPRSLAELKSFVGLGTQTRSRTADETANQINALFAQITQVAESMFLLALEQRSADQFRKIVGACFNDYVHVMRAKSDLLRVALQNDSARTERLVDESLLMLESEFKDEGLARFGAAVNDQAIFTVWTLRRSAIHIWKLRDADCSLGADQDAKREELNAEFALYSAWAQFHLATLSTAIRLEKSVHPDVVPAVLEGLRAMVNASGFARQIVELCIPPGEEPELMPYEWDDEDDELVKSSMSDVDAGRV